MPTRHWKVLAGLGLLAAAGAVLLARRGPEDRPAQRRVAVAVFANRTGDPSLEPLGSMAADWVTRGLSQTGLVDVVDVGAVHVQGRSPEGTPTEPYHLARRNGAGTVVAGSYYLATDTLVIRATVEDVATGSVLQTVPPVHAPATGAVQALDRLREHVTAAIAGGVRRRHQPLTARVAPPRKLRRLPRVRGRADRLLARPAAVRGRGALCPGRRGGQRLPRPPGLARVPRGQRRRLPAHRLDRDGARRAARRAHAVRPAHPGRQRGPLPQRLGGRLPARPPAGRAQAPLELRGVYRGILGRIDEAVAVTSFGAAADTTDILYLGLRGSLAALQGREAERRDFDARLARIPVPALQAMVGTQRTRLALALGERERALELLEAATRVGVIRVLLGSDMLYDPVRGDPRFERINRVER